MSMHAKSIITTSNVWEVSMPVTKQDEFSINNTYNDEQARYYFAKHKRGFNRRFSNWIEHRMASRALDIAGQPESVLDLPCGAGRFWELLSSMPGRKLMGADYSQDMIKTAVSCQQPRVAARFKTLQTSAFDIDLPSASVDCIFCMRLFHHINRQEARARMLHEFHRVSRDTVCVSLWLDGNIQAWRRSQRRRDQTRFLFSRTEIENEFSECGFDVLGSVPLLPGLSVWHTYVLRRREDLHPHRGTKELRVFKSSSA